jgi:hypothetical protein
MGSVRVVWLVHGGCQAHSVRDTAARGVAQTEGSPTMELLIITLVLCLLGTLANMFGVDSRYGLRSHEEEAADYGMNWDASTRG